MPSLKLVLLVMTIICRMPIRAVNSYHKDSVHTSVLTNGVLLPDQNTTHCQNWA